MEIKPFRVVVYKDGYPNNKILFDTKESADAYAEQMKLQRAADIKAAKESPAFKRSQIPAHSWHYISERNY